MKEEPTRKDGVWGTPVRRDSPHGIGGKERASPRKFVRGANGALRWDDGWGAGLISGENDRGIHPQGRRVGHPGHERFLAALRMTNWSLARRESTAQPRVAVLRDPENPRVSRLSYRASSTHRGLALKGATTQATVCGAGYSEKSLGWAGAGVGVLRRATPTTPSTVISESASRGTKMRKAVLFKSGGVICTPESSSARRSLVTTPSSVSLSRNLSRTHRPSSLGRLRNALRSGS